MTPDESSQPKRRRKLPWERGMIWRCVGCRRPHKPHTAQCPCGGRVTEQARWPDTYRPDR